MIDMVPWFFQVDEFSELVSEDLYEWVAQYLVVKRASIEPNFHPLYMSFMNTHNNAVLNTAVCRETYRNIKVIILYITQYSCTSADNGRVS